VYSHIYDYTQEKVGEDADALAERAMLQVRGTMPNLTKNLHLDSYGRLDFDALLKNLAPIPESDRFDLVSSALEEIVYALLAEVGVAFGNEDQTKLTDDIKQLRKT
jgi:hypothetical protein